MKRKKSRMVRIRSEAEPESSADTCYTYSHPLGSLQIAKIYTVHIHTEIYVYMCIYVLYICRCSYIYICIMCMHTHIYTYMSHAFTHRLYIQYLHVYTYIHVLKYIYIRIVYIVRVVFVCVYTLHGKVWPKSSLLSFKER